MDIQDFFSEGGTDTHAVQDEKPEISIGNGTDQLIINPCRLDEPETSHGDRDEKMQEQHRTPSNNITHEVSESGL